MIIYGTQIKSDMSFPLDLPMKSFFNSTVELSSKLPASLESSIICGFPLFWAHNREVYLYGDRVINGNEPGQIWQYEVKGIASFYWVGGEEIIYYKMEVSTTPDHLSFWFIHMVLPFYLALENRCNFLHAGSVEVEGKPIVFIASSMGGKSTMTDYFISQGHPFITDDKLPIFVKNGKFMVTNSHPYHRPYREFETLGNHVRDFTSEFKPIHAFYVLEKSGEDVPIVIEEINGFIKFHALSLNYLFPLAHSATWRLSYLSQMLNIIKVFSVQVPWDKNRLDEVYDTITKHSKGL